MNGAIFDGFLACAPAAAGRGAAVRFAHSRLFLSLSPIIKTPEEAMRISPLYLDMVKDAIIAYDKNDFL